jgi:hypothetical protein
MSWTRALYKKGGWNEVSQAFTTLPQSTEQVLHPDKYFAHEAPVKLTLTDLTSLLNDSKSASPAAADGSTVQPTWKRIAGDVNGEWGFYLILDQFLNSPADSRRAAAGWAGDRTALYENEKGEVLYVSLSSWDSEGDASEFFDAYVKRTDVRYAPAASSSAGASATTRTWKTLEGMVTIDLVGPRVLIVEGCPETLKIGDRWKTFTSPLGR